MTENKENKDMTENDKPKTGDIDPTIKYNQFLHNAGKTIRERAKGFYTEEEIRKFENEAAAPVATRETGRTGETTEENTGNNTGETTKETTGATTGATTEKTTEKTTKETTGETTGETTEETTGATTGAPVEKTEYFEISSQKKPPLSNSTNWLGPVQNFLKNISELKDIRMVLTSIEMLTEIVQKIYENNNRIYFLVRALKEFLQEYFKTKQDIDSLGDFFEEGGIRDDIQNKLDQLSETFYFDMVTKPKLDINFNMDLFYKRWGKWQQVSRDAIIYDFIQRLSEHVLNQIKKYLDEYYCGNAVLGCSFTKFKGELYHRYGKPENFDHHVKLVVTKLKESDPKQLDNLNIYLNRLNQKFNFMNVDMILENTIRNNKPVTSKRSDLVIDDTKVLQTQQDIFLNRGNIVNPNDGKNYLNVPEKNYHSMFQTYGKYYNPSLSQQGNNLEKMFHAILEGKEGIQTDAKKIFLTRDYKFSNMDKKQN